MSNEQVMEVSKYFDVPSNISLADMVKEICSRRNLFDTCQVNFDRTQTGKQHYNFRLVKHGNGVSYAVHMSESNCMTLDAVPDTNHNCKVCENLWSEILNSIYTYIEKTRQKALYRVATSGANVTSRNIAYISK